MKISGFTIVKDALINDYPIIESIKSILPIVDEMIVLIGNCNDETEKLIKSINNIKIKVYHSVWNNTLRKGGKVLAEETDKAFNLINPSYDWAFYLQADEVVHERYYPAILDACAKHKNDNLVQGLLFRYLHFYGNYDLIGCSRKWYSNEVRIIKNNKSITAYRDAQGFRLNNKKILVSPVNAYIYHYGWVKSPKNMKTKIKNVSKFWNEDTEEWRKFLLSKKEFNYSNNFDSLQRFIGTHPAVMQERIKQQNWKIDIDISKKRLSLKDRALYWVEAVTGKRLFSFRNYKII